MKKMTAKQTFKARVRYVEDQVEKLLKEGAGWLQMHNAVFGIGGFATRLFATESDRRKFLASPEGERVNEMLDEARDDLGDPEGIAELSTKANGALSIRLPRSLHAALLAESKLEGVSLNQLCVSKLAVQLAALVRQ